jgi:DNA-binding NarL/FixJ family response regulator
MPEPRTILVVDDEFAILDSLADILQLEGFSVLKASNGLQALDILREQIPDLIIADVMMPEMSGYHLYQRVRQTPKHLHIPFIFLTAKGEAEDIRFGKELGADDYLLKPIHAEDLMAAILGKLKRYDQLKEHSSGPTNLIEAADQNAKSISGSPIGLSSRELDVLRLMVQGLSNNEIAEALFIEQSTVKTHVSNILSKLGVRNRVEAVTFALQAGFTHTE